jgi:hypothetical protein
MEFQVWLIKGILFQIPRLHIIISLIFVSMACLRVKVAENISKLTKRNVKEVENFRTNYSTT